MKRGTQANIANNANISEAFFSQIVNGHRRPSWHTAKTLAKITQTKPELWLDGKPEEIKRAVIELFPDRQEASPH
jgi:transcriptional regulator with XRE-family HTH domain